MKHHDLIMNNHHAIMEIIISSLAIMILWSYDADIESFFTQFTEKQKSYHNAPFVRGQSGTSGGDFGYFHYCVFLQKGEIKKISKTELV